MTPEKEGSDVQKAERAAREEFYLNTLWHELQMQPQAVPVSVSTHLVVVAT